MTNERFFAFMPSAFCVTYFQPDIMFSSRRSTLGTPITNYDHDPSLV